VRCTPPLLLTSSNSTWHGCDKTLLQLLRPFQLLQLKHAHTHTHPFNGPFSRTTRVSRYEKGKTNLDFTEARDGEWPWHQLGHMQVCTSLQTDNHASTPPLCFLQAGCPSCRPTNSVTALKAHPVEAVGTNSPDCPLANQSDYTLLGTYKMQNVTRITKVCKNRTHRYLLSTRMPTV